MAITVVDASPVQKEAAGNPLQANAPGDIWSLDLRGSYSDNVATSTRFLYRQVATFADNVNVAAVLNARWIEDALAPITALLPLLDPSFAFKCAVIRNISTPKAFSSVFNITGATGTWPTAGYTSPAITVNLRYADVTGAKAARKVVYLPGFASDTFEDSKLGSAGGALLEIFIDRLYTLQDGGDDQFQWSHGLVDDVYQDAANGHPAIFIGRLKSRLATLC